MNYKIYGPYSVPRAGARVAKTPEERKKFWSEIEEQVEGLSGACGCYIYTIRNLPWYVGMTHSQAFKNECLQPHKILKLVDAIENLKKPGNIQIYLIARQTPGGKFSKPEKREKLKNQTAPAIRDIKFLESFFIAQSMQRNPNLLNIKETKMLKDLHVPGFFNNGRGESRDRSVKSLCEIMNGKPRQSK